MNKSKNLNNNILSNKNNLFGWSIFFKNLFNIQSLDTCISRLWGSRSPVPGMFVILHLYWVTTSHSQCSQQCVWLNDSWTVQEHLDLGVSQWSYPTLIPCSICRIGLVIGAGDCHHRYLLCNAIYLPFHYFSICTYGHILSECAFNLLTVVNSNTPHMEMSKWSLNGCIQKIWCGCNDVWRENVYGF